MIDYDTFKLKNPFKRFKNLKKTDENIICWSKPFDDEVFEQMILDTKPKIIFELGSFLGYSTIKLINFCKKHGLDNVKVLCIDTWLGGSEHWTHEKNTMVDKFNFCDSISNLYDQFCKNIILNKCENNVITLPNTTDVMFDVLSFYNIKADLIFVDASHDYNSVKRDLFNYNNLLNENGIIYGHDWNWEGVNNAVREFLQSYNTKKVKSLHNKFYKIYD